jgi:hypothetical protein
MRASKKYALLPVALAALAAGAAGAGLSQAQSPPGPSFVRPPRQGRPHLPPASLTPPPVLTVTATATSTPLIPPRTPAATTTATATPAPASATPTRTATPLPPITPTATPGH